MSDWTAGYVAEIDYTHGYYAELNPLRIPLALLSAGLAAPRIEHACELGFGQGISVNMHAAGSDVGWYGTDFNPAQAAFARDLNQAAGGKAELCEDAFLDYAHRTDLPDFDYIALHGIWSWISDENRHVIVDFVRRRLKPGGVLYVSYNTMPGWAAFAPVRHLMALHASEVSGKGRNVLERVDESLAFVGKLLETNPVFARANPQVAKRLEKLRDQNRQYLAHEYFNQHWQPQHFSTVAESLGAAKLSYGCSAHFLDHVDAIHLSPQQQAMLAECHDPMFREAVRDFMVNQQFRRDYWMKGARKLDVLTRAEQLRRVRLVLGVPRAGVSLKVTGALGEAALSEAVYVPLLDLMADHGVRTLGEIEQALRPQGVGLPQLVQAVLVLSGTGVLAPAHEASDVEAVTPRTRALNRHLMERARGNGDVAHLASPVTGGAIGVGRFQQLFLLSLLEGRSAEEDMARFVWRFMAAQGQRIMKDGKPLETVEENIAELAARAREFNERQLPVLRALKVADER